MTLNRVTLIVNGRVSRHDSLFEAFRHLEFVVVYPDSSFWTTGPRIERILLRACEELFLVRE